MHEAPASWSGRRLSRRSDSRATSLSGRSHEESPIGASAFMTSRDRADEFDAGQVPERGEAAR